MLNDKRFYFSQAASQAAVQQTAEAQYGESVETEKAPEAISQAVASLPPEQMFELMKQMKVEDSLLSIV